MGKLFGTDGIRGRANTYPMTIDVAMKAGKALGHYVLDNGDRGLVIGRDPRVSGKMIESALAAGAASTGAHVWLAGVIPTPGIALLSGSVQGAGAGVMISASHNPYHDNGIKVFKKGGVKLDDDEEKMLEANILRDKSVSQDLVGEITIISNSCDQYTQFLLEKFPYKKLDKKPKLIIDCANGASSTCASGVFHSDLFDAVFIHNTPDGVNINENCGSQHTKDLRAAVLAHGADLGLALDGDADRLIAVDDAGDKITGDRILAIIAAHMKANNSLDNNTIVSTIMSNIGLINTLKTLGITHKITDVGDRKVLEEMKRSQAVIGGEDSGHMIFLKDHTTGDGMLTALKLVEVIIASGKPLSKLAQAMTVYPQVLMNVRVDASRPDFTKVDTIADAIKEVESLLGQEGRVLVRYSGTQPLLRVMVEGPTPDITQDCCEKICSAVRKAL